MAHLELLHHWVAVTSYSVTVGRVSHKVWHMTVPQIGLSHEFVMQTILAVAASHKAYLEPEQRHEYSTRAALHQARGMHLQKIALANPGPDNADALFVFSMLIVYIAFANAFPTIDVHDGTGTMQEITHCIHMLRGVRQIIGPVMQWVEKGPLGHLLLDPSNTRSEPSFPDSDTEAHFSKLLVFSSTTHDLNGRNEIEDVEIFTAAAGSLRASFLKTAAIDIENSDTPPIWHWGVRLPADFVERLADRHVVPLVLVAHWFALLARIQHYWWIEGWVDRSMSVIETSLAEGHRHWLDWPKQQISERMKEQRQKEEVSPDIQQNSANDVE